MVVCRNIVDLNCGVWCRTRSLTFRQICKCFSHRYSFGWLKSNRPVFHAGFEVQFKLLLGRLLSQGLIRVLCAIDLGRAACRDLIEISFLVSCSWYTRREASFVVVLINPSNAEYPTKG